MYFPVLLPNIFNHPFTYKSDIKLKVGEYVKVPFGKSTMTGVVWDQFEQKNNKKVYIEVEKKKYEAEIILNPLNAKDIRN